MFLRYVRKGKDKKERERGRKKEKSINVEMKTDKIWRGLNILIKSNFVQHPISLRCEYQGEPPTSQIKFRFPKNDP